MDTLAQPTGHTPRTVLIQPALPAYRQSLFARLAARLGPGFTVFYSPTDLGVLTENAPELAWARQIGALRQLPGGAEWQIGALSVPIRRGDVVVISGAPRCLTNLLQLLRARLCGARTIWWGQYWGANNRKFTFCLRLRLMRLAHGVLLYTDQEVADYLAGPGRCDTRPISALNNGIDVTPIQRMRTPYRAADRPDAFLFIGRITAKSNISLLVRALANAGRPDVVLHIVGDGPDRPSLESKAADLGVAGQIVWHGGTADEARIAAIANQCRAFVYPGAAGLSLIHAMAYGLPCLVHSNRYRHMPEIAAFRANETGLDFPPGDVDGLAAQMAEMLGDDDNMDRWSAEARRRADEEFNVESMARRFARTVESVAARP